LNQQAPYKPLPFQCNVNKIFIDALGAGGARGATGVGGAGGEAQGAFTVTPGEVLYVYVGGKGGGSLTSTLNLGGWNGGGNGSGAGTGGGGGGATDVRRPFVVSNVALTSNVATLTTTTAHGFAVGNSVVVAGLGSPFDGTYAVTAVTANTFSYAKTASNVASTPSNRCGALCASIVGAFPSRVGSWWWRWWW
jgi:hypothetical protein